MTTFKGSYHSDLGHVFYNVALPVVLVQGDGSTLDEEPGLILPMTFRFNTEAVGDRDKLCPLRVTPRYALLWVSGDAYWRVPVIWQPGTALWSAFHSEVKINPLINWSEGVGEKVKPYEVSLLV